MYDEAQQLFTALEKSGKHYDMEKINRAYLFAKKLHAGQYRNSGEEYITHPIAVAEIVASLGLDTDSICAALLHDTVEDCGANVDLPTLRHDFGNDVANLVDGLTKLMEIPFEDKEEEHVENIRKMLLAMSKDIRVIFIKLCDRLHNMRTLDAKPEPKRRVKALETMQVYAPLAHRLGVQKIKQELENLSLNYLDPIGCEEVRNDIEQKYGKNRGFIDNCKTIVEQKLKAAGFEFSLEGRVKSVYSIYRKMYEQNKSFDEIYDFYALRVLVNTELDCYQVLGIIHDTFKSIPGRFKDYISTPKPNNYRSLHTTVIGHDGIPFEVQIRTWEMHHVAEYGVCAHWKYKSGDHTNSDDINKRLEWVAKLVETEDEARDPDEFLRALKIDIFQDETFVFTPKGDVINLPHGATVIDFAYTIHSGVGNSMVGAKINGMIVPLDRVPQNGEIVEILTSANSKGPSRDWLKIVKTSAARTKIRGWFKREKRSENIQLGRAEIDRELHRMGRCTEAQRNEILTNAALSLGIQSVDDLYNTIGYGGISMAKVIRRIQNEFNSIVRTEALPADEPLLSAPVKPHSHRSGIVIDGQDGCAYKLARCCNPLPGDKLVGFITKGYGISIHKRECHNISAHINDPEYADRFVSAYWEEENSSVSDIFECKLDVIARDRIAMIADITVAIADMKISIMQINTQCLTDGSMLISLVIGCKSLEHMKSIMSRIRGISGVESCERGYA